MESDSVDNKRTTWLIRLKVGMAVVALLLLMGTRYAQVAGVPDFTGLTLPPLTNSVMGPLYALLTATMLVIALIPHRLDDEVDAGVAVKLGMELLAAFCAYMAGWYWLTEATGNNPWPYLAVVLLMGGITAIAFMPYVIAIIIGWWTTKRRSNSQGTGSSDGGTHPVA